MPKTKFNLEFPYTEVWDKGYMVVNSEGRRTIILYNSPIDRSSTSYARYLMSVHLGRYLREDEHVDHVDEDKTNDTIGNLQILTPSENNVKHANKKGKLVSEILCPACENIFTRRKGNTQAIPSLKGKITCCGKVCSSIMISKTLTKEERDIISSSSLIRTYRKYN